MMPYALSNMKDWAGVDLGGQDRLKKAFQKSNTLIITPDKIYDLNDDVDDTYDDFKGFLARQEYKMRRWT